MNNHNDNSSCDNDLDPTSSTDNTLLNPKLFNELSSEIKIDDLIYGYHNCCMCQPVGIFTSSNLKN